MIKSHFQLLQVLSNIPQDAVNEHNSTHDGSIHSSLSNCTDDFITIPSTILIKQIILSTDQLKMLCKKEEIISRFSCQHNVNMLRLQANIEKLKSKAEK